MKLCKALKYNKALTADGEALVQSLVDSACIADDASWWAGKCILRSCNTMGRALRKIGGPLLDGAPVTVLVEQDGSLEIETDMLVVGCATGLRIFGKVAADGPQLSVVLDGCEFFEPSEEFGISKALNKCESDLRPQLPADEDGRRAASTLTQIFGDGDMLVLRADAEDVGLLVLSRAEAEYDVAKRRRG